MYGPCLEGQLIDSSCGYSNQSLFHFWCNSLLPCDTQVVSMIIVIQWRLCQSSRCFFSTVFYVIPIPKVGITGGVDFSDLAMSFRVIGVVF